MAADKTGTYPPLIAIMGATAVGKTAVAVALAQHINGEIVSADSRQIYRGMDIGTAKPTPAEVAVVPHHVIDCVAPDEPYTLAHYQTMAYAAIADITARGRVPLLVGGTGQYLAAVLHGWNIPRVAPDAALRADLTAWAQREGTLALHQYLAALDPAAAAAILPDNTRRIIRALEVFYHTGIPISAQQTHTPPPYTQHCYWLTRDTPTLYARIDARVDAMLHAGLLTEIASLRAAGYAWDLPAMSGLGYRQFRPYFDESAPLAACVERLAFDTHRFARKQKNWFRRFNATLLAYDEQQHAACIATIAAHLITTPRQQALNE